MMEEIKKLEEDSRELLDDLRDLGKEIDALNKKIDFKGDFIGDLKRFQDSPEITKLDALIFFREIPFCHRLGRRVDREVFKGLLLFSKMNKALRRFQDYREQSLEKSLKEREKHFIRVKRKRSQDFLLTTIENLRNYETGMVIYSFGVDKIPFSQLFNGLNEEEHLRLLLFIHNLQHYGELKIETIGKEEFVVLNMTKDKIKKRFLECKNLKEEFEHIAYEMEKLLEPEEK